jgi:hypothetical protein
MGRLAVRWPRFNVGQVDTIVLKFAVIVFYTLQSACHDPADMVVKCSLYIVNLWWTCIW